MIWIVFYKLFNGAIEYISLVRSSRSYNLF